MDSRTWSWNTRQRKASKFITMDRFRTNNAVGNSVGSCSQHERRQMLGICNSRCASTVQPAAVHSLGKAYQRIQDA